MTPGRKLTVMAVGAHPDDVELFCGGTMVLAAGGSMRTVIVDLTRGEKGTFGSWEIRAEEAKRAADILGVECRENLDLGDAVLENSLRSRHLLAAAYRKHKPDIVLAPFWEDRHPDHAAAGNIARCAAFDSRLGGLDLGLPPFAPSLMLYYPGHDFVKPTTVVDIGEFFRTKMDAILAYESQFPAGGRRSGVRPVGTDDYPRFIETRCRHYGSMAACSYGEGFISPGPFRISRLSSLIPEGEDIE